MVDMRRKFENRDDLIAYVREQFPDAEAINAQVAELRGGRKAAEQQMRKASYGTEYSHTRNAIDGKVSRLSAYLRYGVLSLNEVREYALTHAGKRFEAEKFVNELAWRDYFQRVYREKGADIWTDIEAYKTGFAPHEYADGLPADIQAGQTGVCFIDDFIAELYQTGYLHNHARMWLAAYVVHWRRVKWQAGARWFLMHLLDGDPASNNLSWQWVASTFSTKPYYYTLENVLKYTGERYQGEPRDFGHEAFVGSYEQMAQRLFPHVDLTESSEYDASKSKQGRDRKGRR